MPEMKIERNVAASIISANLTHVSLMIAGLAVIFTVNERLNGRTIGCASPGTGRLLLEKLKECGVSADVVSYYFVFFNVFDYIVLTIFLLYLIGAMRSLSILKYSSAETEIATTKVRSTLLLSQMATAASFLLTFGVVSGHLTSSA